MDHEAENLTAPGRQRAGWHDRPTVRAQRAVIGVTVGFATCSMLLAAAPTSHAAASPRVPVKAVPGKWIKLGLSQTAAAELWRGPDNRDWAVWSSAVGGRYSMAVISAAGSVAVHPKTIINGWSGVTSQPSLVAHGKTPLLIFSGQKGSGPLGDGCVVGALPASPQWKIQPWSLSANCVFSNVGFGDAVENRSGGLSAAWAGGSGVEYRLSTYPAIPAGTPDGQIGLPLSNAGSVAEANNRAGNGDTYVAFDRFFSKNASKNGVYVKDLTSNGPVLRAPATGTETVTFPAQPQRVAMANTSAHAGIYLAYCSNAGTCSKLLLWKVGSSKTFAIPDSRQGLGVAMSQGPGGRLWLSWYNETSNRVFVVRTNSADNAFGKVVSYRAPCFADGNTHIALSGGSFKRVDVALECLSAGPVKPTVFVTQSPG